MASKRAVKNRIKDFDVLLNEYLQSHPPKSIPKTVSAAMNLDLMTAVEDEVGDLKTINFNDISPVKYKRSEKIFFSTNRKNNISKYRSIFSFLERDRSNKIARAL